MEKILHYILHGQVLRVQRSNNTIIHQSSERRQALVRGDSVTKEEYEKALQEREEVLFRERFKPRKLSSEEIEKLKKEGRI